MGGIFYFHLFKFASKYSRYKSRRQPRDVREEILHGPADGHGGFLDLFAQSPATKQLLGRPGDEPHWTLLALGRMELPW